MSEAHLRNISLVKRKTDSAMYSSWPSRDGDRALFPLKTVGDVRMLFGSHIERDDKQPNLALLSIVVGFMENSLTSQADATASTQLSLGPSSDDEDVTYVNLPLDPALNWDVVETLMVKFESTIKGLCDSSLLGLVRDRDPDPDKHLANVRQLIKHVADIVWNTLCKSQYKDRPHLQSIYSYLTGNRLDCFGVAFAVVAACQLLGLNEVHLALSEDHAWVVFGENGTETAEVTWHGKGSEDKRGQPVQPSKAKTSWLYVAGRPVVCDRFVEVAALVSAINPAINSTTDSLEVGAMQQELLWLLYDNRHLDTFPMAIGNLGDLEEISPSLGRPFCSKLYEEAIRVNRTLYSNHHVYPYTYEGGYHYRQKNYKRAVESWSEAAGVMKLYNYSKDDEEIYKEFMEIANDLIPNIVKTPLQESQILRDPECYKNLLKFYDGICCWEEGSSTPIMHIGWAKPMVASVSKFDHEIRAKAVAAAAAAADDVDVEEEDEEEGNFDTKSRFKRPSSVLSSSAPPTTTHLYSSDCNSPNSCSNNSLASPCSSSALSSTVSPMPSSFSGCLDCTADQDCFQKLDVSSSTPLKPRPPSSVPEKCYATFLHRLATFQNLSRSENNDSGVCDMSTEKDGRRKEMLIGESGGGESGGGLLSPVNVEKSDGETIASLGRFCGVRLLNVDYLLGNSAEPFNTRPTPLLLEICATKKPTAKSSSASSDSGAKTTLFVDTAAVQPSSLYDVDFVVSGRGEKSAPLMLQSAKMRGLESLFGAEKLNASAIQLQLTAQSQVDVRKSTDDSSSLLRPKRSRRE